jgi:3,4-dihydroxy 2-butanone 4-phosphate synthase/GTP cyclohydrolase II
MSTEEVNGFLDLVKRSMLPFSKRISVIENGTTRYYSVERRGLGILNTTYGKFWQYNFAIDDQWEKYSVIVKAELDRENLVPVFTRTDQLVLRTDSGCETGQLLGDLTCECREQLHLALKTIQELGEGMIVSIPRQDGRGMGLTFKLATLWLQDALGVNTVESATLLAPGGVIDIRTYSGVICILKFFGITETCKINLATNNPKKADVFAENGYNVGEFTPIVIEPNHHTEAHLKAKQEHLGHKGLIKKRREP